MIMRNLSILVFATLIMASCSTSKKVSSVNYDNPDKKQELVDDNTFKITVYSKDKSYGYTKDNPVMVGGGSEGPKNERRFLNALCGPNGEEIRYYRLGSCCPFETENSAFGGMLDKYSISYKGLKDDLIIYINMYDSDILKVPVGLGLKK